ncbi:unnamed protein product, partial [Mesorhabditis spiculigera]
MAEGSDAYGDQYSRYLVGSESTENYIPGEDSDYQSFRTGFLKRRSSLDKPAGIITQELHSLKAFSNGYASANVPTGLLYLGLQNGFGDSSGNYTNGHSNGRAAAPTCPDTKCFKMKPLIKRSDRRRRAGVGDLLQYLRDPAQAMIDEYKESVCVKYNPTRITSSYDLPVCRIGQVEQTVALADAIQDMPFDLPPPPPTRLIGTSLMRSKMIRCKRCKNRFIEKNLYERHLRDRHPEDYEVFIAEQEAEMELQRQEEMEANRIEELTSGGFIPPAEDIAADGYEYDVDEIPLPGENNGGVVPHFDSFGGLRYIRRPFKKKVSPQCPFCDKRYRNEFSLKKHFVKKHPECSNFVQCFRCFKCLTDKKELEIHECELTYVCFECTPVRNLVTDARLLNHRKKFHRGANSGFKCNQCNLKFLTPRKLRKHKKMAHVFTKTFQCHFCEEIFISEVSVMTHERIHTGIIKFECKICDFKCNRFLKMEEHTKEEHGYICPICQEKFTEWSELKNHTLSDHGGYLSSDSTSGYIESPRVWVLFKGE